MVIPFALFSQMDSIKSRISFNSDVRFRIEQDWNSKKQDGTFRNNRTRLRYRIRAGVQYEHKWYAAGIRIRTGNPLKQQDPQLTLGDGFQEFGLLPLGFEKAFFQGKWKTGGFWLGKNTFPFAKNNELFWSDNVYPEGVFLNKSFEFKSNIIQSVDFNVGHFIIAANGRAFGEDAYFQGLQANFNLVNNRIQVFPAFYIFKNLPNRPDGGGTFILDYQIIHFGSKFTLSKKPFIALELDYIENIQDYTGNNMISDAFKNERAGYIFALQFGKLKEKGEWMVKGTYANLQQFAAVDFLAQNDWARWDYSSFGSPDGRLTNFNGLEFVIGYKLEKNINLKMKYYLVEQLIPYGAEKETGSRIRFDIDLNF